MKLYVRIKYFAKLVIQVLWTSQMRCQIILRLLVSFDFSFLKRSRCTQRGRPKEGERWLYCCVGWLNREWICSFLNILKQPQHLAPLLQCQHDSETDSSNLELLHWLHWDGSEDSTSCLGDLEKKVGVKCGSPVFWGNKLKSAMEYWYNSSTTSLNS